MGPVVPRRDGNDPQSAAACEERTTAAVKSVLIEVAKNRPPIIDDFHVIRASGAGLALRSYEMVGITGEMPGGAANRLELAVASIPALLAMKGFALDGRYKRSLDRVE